MLRSIITRYAIASIILLPLWTVRAIAPVQAQAESTNSTENTAQPDNSNSSLKSESILSIEGGKKLIAEADQAIDAQEYDVAADKLQKARQIFNQLSNFYLQLFNSFSGLDNRVAESQRQKALETGQLRDEVTYQLALVHRSQNKSELSVPLLIQIIDSQSPSSGLGKKAYEQLVEIGFVDMPLSETPAGNTSPEGLQPQE
ncbi:MAG: hypothetical protein ACFCU5_13800 [Pleurocapsa sp.]